MAKKEFSICTLEDGKWKQWGAGETNIQNRSELVKHWLAKKKHTHVLHRTKEIMTTRALGHANM